MSDSFKEILFLKCYQTEIMYFFADNDKKEVKEKELSENINNLYFTEKKYVNLQQSIFFRSDSEEKEVISFLNETILLGVSSYLNYIRSLVISSEIQFLWYQSNKDYHIQSFYFKKTKFITICTTKREELEILSFKECSLIEELFGTKPVKVCAERFKFLLKEKGATTFFPFEEDQCELAGKYQLFLYKTDASNVSLYYNNLLSYIKEANFEGKIDFNNFHDFPKLNYDYDDWRINYLALETKEVSNPFVQIRLNYCKEVVGNIVLLEENNLHKVHLFSTETLNFLKWCYRTYIKEDFEIISEELKSYCLTYGSFDFNLGEKDNLIVKLFRKFKKNPFTDYAELNYIFANEKVRNVEKNPLFDKGQMTNFEILKCREYFTF